MTTSTSKEGNPGIDEQTKWVIEQMFSCHNKEKKERESAKPKENQEIFQN